MILAAANPINESEYIFPILECVHILGFAVLVGTIAMVDFRLLGFGLQRQTPAALARELSPWTLAGLVVILLSGPMMFSSDPGMYSLNRAFQIKMGLLITAIAFHYTLHRKAALEGASHVKLAACVSLFLWASIIAGGIFIGFV